MTTETTDGNEMPVICCSTFWDARITESMDRYAKVSLSAEVVINHRKVDKLNNRGLREAVEKAVLDNIVTVSKAAKPYGGAK